MIVTGGAGFIGSHLIETVALDRENLPGEMIVVDNFMTGSPDNIQEGTEKEFECFELIEAPAESFWSGREHREAVHLASLASPDHFERRSLEIVSSNVAGLMNCASQLRRGGLLIVASSSEVYGQPQRDDGAMAEDQQLLLRPESVRGCYDISKALMEAMAHRIARTHEVRCLILRIFNTYGPRMPDDGRVINTLVRQARSGQSLTVHGDGNQTRSFCYVSDTVSQIMALRSWALETMRPGQCEVFNVGSDRETSVMDAARIISRRSGVGIELTVPRMDDPQWRRPDMKKSRLRTLLADQVTLEEGIERCF